MSGPGLLLALSGGVDSTVAALLAQQSGYEVTAVRFQLQDEPLPPELPEFCRAHGIPLLLRDCRENFFREVLRPSAELYAAGITPNPCCLCNRTLKFRELFAAAAEAGIELAGTGHYAGILRDEAGEYWLRPAADTAKDQSYFLYGLGQAELSRLVFPLADLAKPQVRELAAAAGLACAAKPDSQDACFQVPGECCGETLRRLAGLAERPGRFRYQGRTVGHHRGIHRYTLGQREGLGVALGVPAYIRSIDGVTGDIELTTDQTALLDSGFMVREVRCCGRRGIPGAGDLTVKVRYRSRPEPCRAERGPEGSLLVYPVSPLRAVTPGQAAVFYSGGLLLGGGLIAGVF